MTKRSNILAKISLRDGHVSPWGESRLAISANKQKQTDSRFVLLQSFQTAAKYTRNNLIYSELPPPPRFKKNKTIHCAGMLPPRAALWHFVPIPLGRSCSVSTVRDKYI